MVFFTIQITTQPGIFLEFYRVENINRAAAEWGRGQMKHEQQVLGKFKRSLLTMSWKPLTLHPTQCLNLSPQSDRIKINVSKRISLVSAGSGIFHKRHHLTWTRGNFDGQTGGVLVNIGRDAGQHTVIYRLHPTEQYIPNTLEVKKPNQEEMEVQENE